MMSITLTINGQQVRAEAGDSVLAAARNSNIYIPTLCYDPDLKPAGACRLCIVEIDGMTQLRQAEVAIWANKFAVDNPIDAASLFIQKAFSMSEYLAGKLYYGGTAEKRSIMKRTEFLEALKEKSSDKEVKEECQRLLSLWQDNSA